MIPAYNEESNIEKVVDRLIKGFPQYDYLVINDGSRDRTGEICRARGYEFLDLPVNLGLAGGFQAGLKYAAKKGYRYAVQLDGDGSTARSTWRHDEKDGGGVRTLSSDPGL